MAGKPYQSILTPHINEIIVLRRKKPPVSYSRISVLLHDKYQITIGKVGIRDFVKRQARKVTKTCKYAWDIELSEADNQPAAEARFIEKPTVSKPSVSEKPKQAEEEEEDDDVPRFEDVMKYSDSYNLTLMSPEEAVALEAKIRRKIERDKLKATQSESKQTVPDMPIAAKPTDKPTQDVSDDDENFDDLPKFADVMKYSDSYNLTILSPEEAEALKERFRRKKERDKLRAAQSESKQTVPGKPIAAKPDFPDKTKQLIAELETELDVSQLPEITYSDTYNLTRLPDAEAAKWLKLIEERKKQ